ncbi:hypothetical protein WJX77_003581 [Trebouxia sp. C0004]
MQSSTLRSGLRLTCSPVLLRASCRCKLVIQRKSWRPVSVRAASDRHRQAVDAQAGQNLASAEVVPEYPSPSNNQQSQQYQQHYGVPQYPSPPPQYDRKSSSGGWPNVLWVFIGVVIATVVSKVYGVVSSPGGVQGWMMQQAMKAAMKNMGGQPGQPGANPFGAGGMPGGMAAGFPGMPPNMQGAMGQGWPPAVDTTARPAGAPPQSQSADSSQQPPFNQDVNKGKRFQEHKAQQAKRETVADASPRSSASSPSVASSGPSSTFVNPPKQSASFFDVGDEDEASSSSAASSNPAGPGSTSNGSSGFFDNNQFSGAGFGQQQQQQQQQQQASSSGASPGGKGAVEAMEKMLKDPAMQKLLYPYLPEGMRNPQTFEWMMSNPEYRTQLEQMMEKQGAFDPKMMEALQGEAGSVDVEQSLKEMNTTPEEVMQKIMSDPELAVAFSKAEVQKAIMDCTQNPMNIIKYQSNPEVMMVFTKMQQLFPQGTGGGMPPMPGQQ